MPRPLVVLVALAAALGLADVGDLLPARLRPLPAVAVRGGCAASQVLLTGWAQVARADHGIDRPGYLRVYAHERKIFCWTASQASRQKDRKRILDLNDVADSMHKIRVADLVITLNVRDEGSEFPQIIFKIAKHRTGKSRVEIGPMPTEYERGRICPILEPT